jgi:hypothetical protein
MSEEFICLLIVLVAVGFFCAGRAYEIDRHGMERWQRGFDAAKKIYGRSN